MRRMVSKFFYAWAVFLRMSLERGVRNEESAKKYRVISPRNEPARTFLLMLFFFNLLQYLRADCTFETVIEVLSSYSVAYPGCCFFCAPTVLLTLSKISPSH